MTGQRFINVTAVLLAAVLFLSVNLLSKNLSGGWRIDLTERQLFTLSDGTRNLLGGLGEPVTLKLYFSRSLLAKAPNLRNHSEAVINMLEEFTAVANGNIRLEIIDPQPFSEAEDRAVDAGLSAVSVGRGGEKFYFGLVGVNVTDDQETIAFFSPQRARFLEYDLASAIYGLSNPDRPVLTVISGFPVEWGAGGVQAAMRGQSRPYGLMQSLRELFEVRVAAAGFTSIDPDTDILMMLHARDLTDAQLYAIDQFILTGGKALIFADPYSETGAGLPTAQGQPPDPSDRHESLTPALLQAWGVEIENDMIVGDRRYATRVNVGRGRRSIVDYVGWISLPAKALNREDVITAEMRRSLLMPTVGRIRQINETGLSLTPLAMSSDNAQLIPASRFRTAPDPRVLLAEFKPSGERYVLAARLRGLAKSAFEAPPEGVESDPGAHIAVAGQPVDIILVADADMMDDRYWLRRLSLGGGREILQPTSGNSDFMVNALDNLTGSSDLIGLRGRADGERPFERITEIRREAEQRYLAEEQELVGKLSETEKKLAELQSKAGEGESDLLTAQEQQAIDEFQDEKLQTRRQLRAVQHNLRRDIEALQSNLQILNIALMPALVLVIAAGVAALRRRRRLLGQRTREN